MSYLQTIIKYCDKEQLFEELKIKEKAALVY